MINIKTSRSGKKVSADSTRVIKKNLLIIKSKSYRMEGVKHFLENRDWRVYITSDLKSGLEYMLSEQPAFIMISMDHPAKAVRKLPRVLPQVSQACIIPFAENSSSASSKALNDVNSRFAIFPPVTGPAIERTVFKFLQGEKPKAQRPEGSLGVREEGAAGEGHAEFATPDHYVDPESDQPGFVSSKSKSPSEMQVLTGGAKNEAGGLPGTYVQSGDVRTSLGTSFDMNALASLLKGDGKGDTEDSEFQTGDDMGDWRLPKKLDHQHKEGGNLIALANKGPQKKPGEVGGFTGFDADSSGEKGSLRARQREDLILNNPEKDSAGNFRPSQMRIQSGAGKWGDDSLISIGTKQALAQVSDSPVDVHNQLGSTDNVACIAVESSRFAGYLVTAFGHQRKIDAAFVTLVKHRLFKFLSENGEQISREEQLHISIKEVAFEAWSLECAEFLRKSIHQGTEVAMAFFPNSQAYTHVGESKDERMAAVHIEDLKGDTQVEFNLYLYLASNDKYILYTPRGSKFYEKQRTKLLTSGVTSMHVEKTAVEDFSKYKAQNYLNGQIAEYEARQKNKSRKRDPA